MNIKPRHTKIVETLKLDDKTIVREDYMKYPKSESNVYAIDNKGNIIWFAELPSVDDCYANKMRIENKLLKICSWNCFMVSLDLKNGKIIEKKFVK